MLLLHMSRPAGLMPLNAIVAARIKVVRVVLFFTEYAYKLTDPGSYLDLG
jgi:hypothetical protein